jgi:hypothetical protein
MEFWKIVLKYDNSKDINELQLYDAKTYFGGYLKIKRSYFNELAKIIKSNNNYMTGKAIEKVISPDNADWTFNSWMFLIIKDNEKGKTFWLFIKREKDLSGVLVAIGPKTFAEYNKENIEAKREIKQILSFIITYGNKFQVIILLPRYLR